MHTERVTVRQLSLTAASRAGLQGVVPEIEDALRTVSWPGAGRTGAVLMIRSLNLGKLRRGATRHQIGQVITARLAALPLAWAHPEQSGHDAQVMAWPSRAACLAHVAARMARGDAQAGGVAWWIPRALECDGPAGVDQEALIRAVRALWQDMGPAGLGAAITRMVAAGAASQAAAILAALADEMVAVLAGDAPELADQPLPLPAAQTPAMAHEADVTQLAVSRRDLLHAVTRIDPSIAQLWTSLQAHAPLRGLPRARLTAILLHLLRARSAPQSWPALTRRLLRDMSGATTQGRRSRPGQDATAPRGGVARHMPEPGPVAPASRPAPETGVDAATRAAADSTPAGPDPALRPEAAPTRAGGVIMLMNLITRLGLPEADAAQQSDVSLQLLHHFTARLPDAAAMAAALPQPSGDGPGAVPDKAGWTAPDDVLAPLRGHLAPRGGLCFLRGTSLCLGRDTTGRGTAPRTPTPPGRPAPDLLGGLALALQRAVFASTGAGWRVMATRSGHVSATETHIDVTLDLADVRLAERLAGLDLSPGWLPWLGRVVTLHFEPLARVGGGDE